MNEVSQSKYIHWVSNTVVGAMSCFETGAMTKQQVIDLVLHLKERSISEKQSKFFDAYLRLLDRVEAVIEDRCDEQD